MFYEEKSVVSRLAYYLSYLASEECQYSSRKLFSKEAMVKMIWWEVKNRVECNSYYNSVQNKSFLWGFAPLPLELAAGTNVLDFGSLHFSYSSKTFVVLIATKSASIRW
ncbi:hypothetical protein CFP56_041320 [Quercus suber]|uniref:Uncharacterized protein n=1 Tax=Quercus suber TaxID=58331 RepID=A0AAW0LL54_QUESU